MLSLTTAQRDLLMLLLDAEEPIGAAALGERLHMSARQIHYGLRDVAGWIERRNASLRYTPGSGVQLVCTPNQRQRLQSELASQARFQLVLSADQRQQLLAMTLLAAPEPLTLNQLQQDLAVARATVLKDLEAIEPWLDRFGLLLARRQHRGCWVDGQEFARRQALAALLWGDVPFERPLVAVEDDAGLLFSLARDARFLPAVDHVNTLMSAWDMTAVEPLVTQAESAVGGRYTDTAMLTVRLALAIQMQRVANGQVIDQHDLDDRYLVEWAAVQPVWALVTQLGRHLWPTLAPETRAAEQAALAVHLLAAARDTPWHTGEGYGLLSAPLIDQLIAVIASLAHAPAMAQDHLLREGLEALLPPASVRVRFGVWMPPPAPSDVQSERYSSERALATRLADQIASATRIRLPDDTIDDLVLLLRAAVVRARPEHTRHILVVCPSGIATTQLLLARLKSRFPRLGVFEVLPLRELTSERVASADLILTTVPLPATWNVPIDILHVHPMLKPEDIAALTHWMG